MPSPIGHSLIGCATGILLIMPRCSPRTLVGLLWQNRWGLVGCAAIANVPDIDFVPGLWIGELNRFHHGPSHSLFWAILVAVTIGALVQEFRPGKGLAVGSALFILIAGHLVADCLCQDFAEPYGVMLFWPVDKTYWLSPASLFLAMEKATLADVFSLANLGAAWRELWIGAACVAAAVAGSLGWSRRSESFSDSRDQESE